ncbi:S1 RNA-binding domain-containing protein, partial [Streptococcus suis]
HYNERTMSLHGEKSGKVFKVGQQIRVKLIRADKETGDIDFEYLPSDFDVVEKVPKDKKDKKDKKGRKPRHS